MQVRQDLTDLCCCLVLVCQGDWQRADSVLTAWSCCGHTPHIAAWVGHSSTLKQGNVSQQPSSFGALLFVPKICQDHGIMHTLNCLKNMQAMSHYKLKADFSKTVTAVLIALWGTGIYSMNITCYISEIRRHCFGWPNYSSFFPSYSGLPVKKSPIPI